MERVEVESSALNSTPTGKPTGKPHKVGLAPPSSTRGRFFLILWPIRAINEDYGRPTTDRKKEREERRKRPAVSTAGQSPQWSLRVKLELRP